MLVGELMDEPGLDEGRHRRALRGLERINWWSGSARILWPSIEALARRAEGQPIKALDLATGAGDVPLGLWRRARGAGLELEIDACDRSGQAIQYARRRAARAGVPVRFFQADALATDWDDAEKRPAYDVVISSLFLHHLESTDALRLLRGMAALTRHLVLINDLARCRAGLTLAALGTRLLTRSEIVHTDGPRSVRSAFTVEEALKLADEAGLPDATVQRRWPYRFLLEWRRQ